MYKASSIIICSVRNENMFCIFVDLCSQEFWQIRSNYLTRGPLDRITSTGNIIKGEKIFLFEFLIFLYISDNKDKNV